MIQFLKNHPFAIEAHFDSSIVLTFAVPKQQLVNFIPACLTLDTFQDKWAFIAIALVQTRDLRPKGFPKFMGNNFFLVGYRIFVRYTNNSGKRLRGLYILKSQTDKKRMELLGNIFTHYNYTTTDIRLVNNGKIRTIQSEESQFNVILEQRDDDVEIPVGSPFTTWKDARQFAGPLPYTFTVNTKNMTMLSILGIRKNWKPKPLHVKSYHFEFLDELKLQGLVLANAFEINNVPYFWEKGKLESLQ